MECVALTIAAQGISEHAQIAVTLLIIHLFLG